MAIRRRNPGQPGMATGPMAAPTLTTDPAREERDQAIRARFHAARAAWMGAGMPDEGVPLTQEMRAAERDFWNRR